jgi:hypothetical protein
MREGAWKKPWGRNDPDGWSGKGQWGVHVVGRSDVEVVMKQGQRGKLFKRKSQSKDW